MNDLRLNRRVAQWILLGLSVIGFIMLGVQWLTAPNNELKNLGDFAGLVIGALGLAGFIFLDPEGLVRSLSGRSGQYAVATIFVSALFVFLVFVVYWGIQALKLPPFDATELQKYSLSTPTIDLLSKMQDEVRAIAFVADNDAETRDEVDGWLKQYALYSGGKITYEFADADRDPALAAQWEVDRQPAVVFIKGEQSANASLIDESSLTGALAKILSGEARQAYIVVGHGEKSLEEFGDLGLSDAKSLLENANFQIEELNLFTDPSVPEDADLVIIAGPQTRFSDAETAALQAYLDRGGKLIFMYDPPTGIEALLAGIRAVAFSKDGSRFATGGADGVVIIWDTASHQRLQELRGHSAAVIDVSFSPDGAQVATASTDGTARVWSVETGEQLTQLEGQTGLIQRILYSPDGNVLVSIGEDRFINIWDGHTFEPLTSPPVSLPAPLYAVAFSPDGSQFAVAGGGQTNTGEKIGVVYLFETATAAQTGDEHNVQKEAVYYIAYSPDGSSLYTATQGGRVGTLNIATGENTASSLYADFGISAMAVMPDGSQVYGLGDGSIRIHPADATTLDNDQIFTGHTSIIWTIASAPDGVSFVSGSADGTLRFWEAGQSESVSVLTAHTDIDPLVTYLAETWGIQVNSDLVLSIREDKSSPLAAIINYDSSAPITASLSQSSPTLMLTAHSIQHSGAAAENVQIVDLATSLTDDQGGSWGEMNPFEQAGSNAQYDSGEDNPSPLTLAVSAENTTTTARIVVFGDSDFATNQVLRNYTFNNDLLLNAANWLTQGSSFVSIPTKDVGLRTLNEPLSQRNFVIIAVTTVCVIPGLTLMAGGIIWFVRRRRR